MTAAEFTSVELLDLSFLDEELERSASEQTQPNGSSPLVGSGSGNEARTVDLQPGSIPPPQFHRGPALPG